MRNTLEQVGVGAGTMEGHRFGFRVNTINQNPIALNMAVKTPFPLAVQGMVLMFRRQGNFPGKQAHYRNKFTYVFMAFFRQGKVFFEAVCALGFKYSLTPQLCQQFLKGIKGRRGDFSPRHGPALPDSRGGFGVGYIFLFAARGTHIIVRGGNFGFPRHIQGQPLAGGYFNGLLYSHKESIGGMAA